MIIKIIHIYSLFLNIGAFGIIYGCTIQRGWDQEAVGVKTVKGKSMLLMSTTAFTHILIPWHFLTQYRYDRINYKLYDLYIYVCSQIQQVTYNAHQSWDCKSYVFAQL